MRNFYKFAFVGWFITAFPRTSKTLVILAAVALLFGMCMAAVKR
jgi:hypothetical protein